METTTEQARKSAERVIDTAEQNAGRALVALLGAYEAATDEVGALPGSSPLVRLAEAARIALFWVGDPVAKGIDRRTVLAELVAENQLLTDAIKAARNLCGSYTPEPPPIMSGPGLSEWGIGYNRGTRDLADAVLSQIRMALNTDPTCGNCDDVVENGQCVGCGEETSTTEAGK